MRKLFLIGASILLASFTMGQVPSNERCAAQIIHEQKMLTNSKYQSKQEAIERHTQAFVKKRIAPLATEVRVIPVYVHVIYDEAVPEQNISQAQIESQIEVLNLDFRGANTDINNVPSEFAGSVADYGIEFELVGITRKSSTRSSWGTSDDMKRSSEGGIDPITPATHLNMWVCEIGGGILGYAQFPGGSAATDGVVMAPEFFGSSDYGTFYLAAPYDKGRTATHEVGHYLNLRHIWGDGDCSEDDFVADTPIAGHENYGCPSYPSKSCAGNVDYTSDMFMNYMDYVNDECMFMFTTGQKMRTAAIFQPGGAREFLGNIDDGCDLDAPVNLMASDITDESFTLSWGAVFSADAYEIYINGEVINTAATSFDITGLSAATYYSVRVRANCTVGSGDYSDELVVNTTGCRQGPAVLVLNTDNYGDETSWILEKDGSQVASGSDYSGFSTYHEFFNYGDGEYTFTIEDEYGDGMCCSYGEGSYTILDADGEIITTGGDFGSLESFTYCVSGSVVDTQVPDAPTNLVVSDITQTSANLCWEASTDNIGVRWYNIYFGGYLVAYADENSINLADLSPHTTYNVSVTAVDLAGNESFPDTLSFMTSSHCIEAAQAISGSNAVPPTIASQYWFKYTMESNNKLLLTSGTEEYVELIYDACTSEQFVGYGAGSATAVGLEAGDEVYIIWNISNGGDFSFNLSEVPLEAGDDCENAVLADLGINSVPVTNNSFYYYTYTMPSDSKLILSSSSGYPVAAYIGLCSNSNLINSGVNELEIVVLEEGDVVTIQWLSGGVGDFDWELSLAPKGPGDICDTAFEATLGSNTAPYADYWYKFTAADAATYTISSVGFTSVDTYLQVYGDCAGTLITANDDFDDFQSQIEIELEENETIYILWADMYSSTGFEWSITSSQSIQFNALVNKTFGDDSFDLLATATSGLSISYESSDPTVATITGNTVKIMGTGTTTITAFQHGNAAYEAAPHVEQELTITQGSQTISFESIEDQSRSDGSVKLIAEASSGLEVIFEIISGPATVDGAILTFTGEGTVLVRALQPGNDNYKAAPPVEQQFDIVTVTALPETISKARLVTYPNPVKNELNIELRKFSDTATMTIADLRGQYMMKVKPSEKRIDVSSLNEGMYLLIVTDREQTVVHKFIKE